GEEPEQVDGAVEGRACVCGDEAEVRICEATLSRTEEECHPTVRGVRAGESVLGAEKTVALGTGLARERRLLITGEPPKRAEDRERPNPSACTGLAEHLLPRRHGLIQSFPSCCGTEPETTGAVPQHESATSDGKRVSNHLPKEKHESEETPLRENASSKRVFQHQRLLTTVSRKPPTRSAGRNARAHHTPRPTRGRIERQSPELLSGGGLHTLGGLFDKSCDSPRLRHVDGVAALDLSDRRASPPGHETLGIRWNHLVVGNDEVPTRLGSPRRFTDLAAQRLHAPWDLGVGDDRGFFCVHVGCERGGKLRPVEEQIA